MSYFDQMEEIWWDKDDFFGDSIDDRWSQNGSGGGSAAVLDEGTGGVLRITTGSSDDDYWQVKWGDIRTLYAVNEVALEFKAKLETAVVAFNLTFLPDMPSLVVI